MRTIAVTALMSSALTVAAVCAFGQSTEYNGPRTWPRGDALTDQIIVKWRSDATAAVINARVEQISSAATARITRKRSIANSAEVLKLSPSTQPAEIQALIERLNVDPSVEYAVADQRRFIHAIPSDPLISEQWHLLSAQPSATRSEGAWDVTTGSAATVVAVLDTGVHFDHPDLGRVENGGKLFSGFDFVSEVVVANDGDGRDNDASDPGDWVSAQDALQSPFNTGDCIPAGRTEVTSSWHGTRVASLIGAATNNAIGLAGAGWNTVLLPVRVLGKCGGYDSDIIAGMRWAAGLPVNGAPQNLTPATVINLSLGGDGACSIAQQSTVDELTARGVVIVASVGNEGGPVGSPGNCAGVIGVAGLRHAGTKVGFSNLGPQVALGAPGGNCVNTGFGQPCQFSIMVATNTGVTTPATSTYTDLFNFNVGTSFAAPLVAGAAALMHSVNAQLSPANYATILKETATAFPTGSATATNVCHVPAGPADLQALECVCTTETCGAGMLNTNAAVLAAQRPFAIVQAPEILDPGVEVTIDGAGSFAANSRSIDRFRWNALNVSGAAPSFADASQATTTVQVAGPGAFTLQLTVTDDQGDQDTTEVMIATRAAPAPPANPPSTASGSGRSGGGATDGAFLAAVFLLLVFHWLRPIRGRRSGFNPTRTTSG